MFILNTFLGFLIAQVYDVVRRDRNSGATPEKFNLVFFLKDTYQKLVLSLVLSLLIATAVHFNAKEVLSLFNGYENLSDLIYLPIGAAPEMVLQWAKKKYGFGQPEKVEGYQRKKQKL
jgi:hypothetical protein